MPREKIDPLARRAELLKTEAYVSPLRTWRHTTEADHPVQGVVHPMLDIRMPTICGACGCEVELYPS